MGNLPSDPIPEDDLQEVIPPLMRLPPELLEKVAWLISPRALSSTHPSFRQLLYSEYVEFQRVVSSLHYPELWTHLALNHARARNIRQLVLDNVQPSIIPSLLDECPSQAARNSNSESSDEDIPESQLISAISRMKGLERFTYRLDPFSNRDGLWDALWENCPNLQDLEVADHDDLGIPRGRKKGKRKEIAREGIHGSSLFKAKNLKRFVWYSSFKPIDFSISVHLGQLEISLIRENPNLEELRIHYFNQDLAVTYGGALIASAHWPKLRILELSRFHAGDEEAVSSFFDRHPLLEICELDQADATSGRYVYMDDLEDDALPKLRRFRGGIDNVIAVLRSSQRKNVRAIGGLQFDTIMLGSMRPSHWTTSPNGKVLLECLANSGVKDLEGDFALVISDKVDLDRLLAACPRLERLSLSCSVAGYLETYLPAFSQLKSLKCLSFPLQHLSVAVPKPASGSMSLQASYHLNSIGSRSGSNPSFLSTLKLKAKMIAAVCPSLERIDFGFSGFRNGGVAVIERYGDNYKEGGLWQGNKEVSEIRFEDGRSWEWGVGGYEDDLEQLKTEAQERSGDEIEISKEEVCMRKSGLETMREKIVEEGKRERELNRTRSKAAGVYEKVEES